jgi:drug/metabolite transporter (DMT)-like permease
MDSASGSEAEPTAAAFTRARPNVLRGILLMCAGVSAFPFMNAAVKLLAQNYPVTEIVWARFTGHLIIMLLIFLPRYRWGLLRTRRPLVQIGRSILMLVSNMVFVMAIGRVPLATASAIGFTSPLVVTALSVPLLHETVGWRRWSAVIVGFGGALMVIRPGSGFHDPAVLLLVVSAVAYALYQIATRWISQHDDAATGIIFAALLGSLAMSVLLPFDFILPRSLLDLALFCCLGLLGGTGHYLIIRAFQLGQAAVIAPLGYVELVGTVILGYLIFDNLPDLWTWLGAGVIIASGIYIALRERLQTARRAKPSRHNIVRMLAVFAAIACHQRGWQRHRHHSRRQMGRRKRRCRRYDRSADCRSCCLGHRDDWHRRVAQQTSERRTKHQAGPNAALMGARHHHLAIVPVDAGDRVAPIRPITDDRGRRYARRQPGNRRLLRFDGLRPPGVRHQVLRIVANRRRVHLPIAHHERDKA